MKKYGVILVISFWISTGGMNIIIAKATPSFVRRSKISHMCSIRLRSGDGEGHNI